MSFVYQTLENVATTTPFVSGNEINYPQIFHGVTVRFTCMNGRLKEEIVFSQTARDSLVNPSRYGLSPNDTYLMFMAEIDLQPGNINAMARTAAGKTPIRNGNRFTFNGTDQIDFEDAQENLYFSLPNDYAWAANDSAGENVVPVFRVFRVFNTQQGRHYLLVGVPWTWVNTAPAGPLIIDPTVTLDNSNAFRDTYLHSTSYFGSDATLMIGKQSGSAKKRTIIKLNLTSAGIPDSAKILNSQLQLYYYDAQGSAWTDRWVQAHQVLKAWAEGQANRDNRQTGLAWGAQYAALDDTDAASTMESTMLFQSGQTGTWKSWNLTSLTQKWINGTVANNGVILWATNEDTDAYDLRFYSRENATNQPKLVVTWSNTPKTVYFLKDHLGSVRATVDQTGAVVGYEDYDPWGYALGGRTMKTPWDSLQAVGKNKFTGFEWDNEFGVNWFHSPWRPFDPEIARWFILDPAANKFPGWSPYNYSLNNPLKYVDRDGKFPILIIGAAIAGAFIADAIFADPANAPSPRDVAQGNVYQGKSDAQFAVEQGIGAGLGAFGAKLLGQAVGALGRSLSDDAASAAAKLANAGDEVGDAAPQLAKVLEGHEAGQGFSGAFDATSGKINIRPSPNQRGAPIPEGGVPRGGGHSIVSGQLGGNTTTHSGFTVILQKDGTLAVTWKSSSLNKTSDALVPKDLRPQIVKTIEEQTGRKVSSF